MTHPKSVLFFTLALLTPLTASAVPTQVNHAGYLTDGTGTPTDGMRTITFGIYENKKFGTPFWTETHEVDVGHGYYAVVLGEIEPLDGDLFLGDTLYLEVDTGGFRPGTRAPMVSTPYAFRADEATSLSGGPVDATEIWVDGSPVIDIDGNWVGGTMMVDWTDLTGVPADFADGIDDVLTETDVDTMVSDNGYAYDADLFSGDWADLTGIPSDVMDGDGDLLADMSCLDGDIIVWDGLALTWTCDLDADSVLTEAEVVAMVTANGFALTADLATVATSGDYADLTGVPTELADGDDDTMASLSCLTGEVAKWDGLGWVCAGDTDTDTILTEGDVDAYVADNGFALTADLAIVATTGAWSDLTGIPSDLVDGDGDLLADMSCLDGDIIVWDGVALAWTCDLDADSVLTEAEVDAYVSNNGFALTSDLAAVATSGAWSDLTGVPADADTQLTEAEVDAYADNNGYALSSDLATVATSGAWSDLVGTPSDADTLAMLGCGDGDLPIWNAGTGAWLCNNHTSDPDAHHSSTSDGLNITPASVTIQSTMTALNDGSLDLGAAVDDELTASMVQTLTGGGVADSLHNHTADGGSSSGGSCYTAMGTDSCGVNYTAMYTGMVVATTEGTWGSAGHFCVQSDAVSYIGVTSYYDNVYSVGTGDKYNAADSYIACAMCCPD
jgi:hypothetical protein